MGDPRRVVGPGGTIGMLGGGQLGRMTALAAARLGIRCHVFCPDADSPTAQVADAATVAAYDDLAALDAFAEAVDVVTFEFENIPHATVQRLAACVPVRPGWEALRIAQDRVAEKAFLNDHGVATAPWVAVESGAGLAGAVERIGLPAILKSARFGYDGKGQVALGPDDAGAAALAAAWESMAGPRGILEGRIEFECEISVIVARGLDGASACYVPVENRHIDHILSETIAPAPIVGTLAAEAEAIAGRIAEALDIVGLLAVEMFVLPENAGERRILVNEVAPRPHNSGHWTIDACATSQFEQFVRAVCGLPLGSPERHSDAVMRNLIGAAADDWPDLVAEPGACVHLYGKAEIRPGRKMGHVTRLAPRRR